MFFLFDGSPTLSKHYWIFHLAFAMSIWLRPVPVTGILHKIQKKGHKLKDRERFSAVQVISILNGMPEGAADPSKGGAAYSTVDPPP